MAWDRPFDDAADDAPAEPHPQRRGPGADATAARAGRAEVRTRAEHYDVLRAADGGSGQLGGDHDPAGGGADRGPGAEAERSGWDAVDTGDRPPPDRIRVSPE